MHNTFNKNYLDLKTQRDEYLIKLRQDAQARNQNVRDTNANKLKADH